MPLGRIPSAGFRDAFDQALTRKVDELKFSAHASDRLERRKIDLSSHDLQRIGEGVNSLANKGVKDGLVVMGNLRFVVSVDNRTVITAMTARDDRDVYTNIDGVAFA
jgi:flagellar operon protein